MFNKKGVSLVTVLLFMLIATIAGTATYKWLSSAQGSSASRMNVAEAQQASRAGLDAVRAWMTYHANDVGAVMRQYVDGGNKPVRLDAVVKAFGSHKQDYSVWLTGLDASSAPYRLKITSVGTARGGSATYSENSILKVNGLYRVRIPEKHLGINFDGAFAGQHAGITGSDSLESGLITGDFEANNIPVIYSKMVITGKAKYGGDINHLGDVYIGKGIETTGKITFGNATTTDTLVAYVGGPVKCASGQPFTVYGDLYLNGPIEDCILDVKGNLTVNANLQVAFSNNNYKISVGKNMVFTENGKMDFKKEGANFNQYTTITVGGNLYLPDKIEAHCELNGQCGDVAGSKMITVSGKVYRYNATNYYKILQQNSAGSSYGIYMNTTDQASIYDSEDYNKNHRITSISATAGFDSQTITEWSRNDNVLKNVSGQYWTKIDKINAYGSLIVDNAIPQPILVDHETDWKAKIANGLCTGIADNGSFDMDDNAVDALNTCYETLNSSQLYNGFLIIKWNYTQNKQPSHTLNHKFVLYATEKLGGDPYLPATSDDGMVLLYLEKGAGQLNAVGEHNYVIYSKEDIDQINGLKLTGTLILEPGKKLLKTQGQTRLQFGRTVVNTMAEAGLIKENPEYTAVANPDGTGGAYAVGAGTLDDYYVATAPELNISLESQYKNKEIDPASLNESKRTDIQPSVIVMPRVIYVPQNLVGKLSDYYSVLNLNKATDKGNASVACNPGGLSTTLKYDGKTLVPDDIYTCKYESNYGDNPFYVVVSGKKGKTPAVTFETPNWTQITAGGGAATVNMLVKQATGSANMTVGVNVYNLPDSWTLTPQAGVSAQSVNSGVDGMRAYVVTFKANEAKKPLFKISAPTGAEAATVHFELAEPLSGCVVGTPSTYDVSISGSATINRVAIPSSFCDGHATITASNNTAYNCTDVVSSDWPNCDGIQKGVWVYPHCNSLTTISENSSWTCGTNYSIYLQKNNISPHCVAFIPDTSLEADNDGTYTLYGSLKRKPYKLYVKMVGEKGSATPQVSVKKTADESSYTVVDPITTENGYKVYQVYADYRVKAEIKNKGDNILNYWECKGADCSVNNGVINADTAVYLVTGVDTLIAHFNERDEHCFFDSFSERENSAGSNEDFVAWCPSNNQTYENCIDRCKGNKTHCSVGSEGHAYEGYDSSANWMLIYANRKECEFGWPVCITYSRDFKEFVQPSSHGDVVEFFLDDGLLQSPKLTNLSDFRNVYAPTFILNRAKAGTNGKMSLKMKVPTGTSSTIDKIFGIGKDYNDGAVLRSDAAGTSYLTVTLYRANLFTDGRLGASARVCYVSGLENSDDKKKNDCLETNFKNKYDGSYVPMESITDLTLNITLDGASLTIDFDYNMAFIGAGSHDLGYASFDLSQLKNTSLSYGAPGHEYVGIKMFNPYYRYKDISWSSDTYSDKCFDTPRIYCSFANQYLGGTVPKDSNVTPWVSMSSWFNNNSDCKAIEYYYNGCDMSSSLYSRNFRYLTYSLDCMLDDIGGFWDKGGRLYTSVYNFEDQGYHKIDTSRTMAVFKNLRLSGYAKNASVQITCGSTTYSTDCGQFYVGDIIPCTKHERSFDQDVTCSLDPCFVDMPDGEYANLREAKLSMTISNLNGAINAYLIDQNNVASDPYPINADGTIEFDVSQVSEKMGFDPQTVESVKFVGSSGFTVSGLQSYCSNAPGISGCTASFDGSGFMINSTITNTINAANGGCTVSNNEDIFSDMVQDCPANGSFYVQGSDVYETLNSGITDSQDFTFTITLMDKEGVQTSCQTNTVNVQKTAMSCWVDDSEINAGENLPAFKYYMQNCPTGGCNATVELVGKADAEVTYNKNCTEDVSCESQSWTPADVNTAAGTLTYRLTYSTLPVCEATVTVKEVTPASVSSCSLSEDGKFTANIVPATDGSSWQGIVAVSDAQGVTVPNSSQQHSGTETSWTITLPTIAPQASNATYVVNFTLNGNAVELSGCTPSFTVAGNGQITPGPDDPPTPDPTVSATCSYTTNTTDGSVDYTISNVSGCDNSDCSVVVKKGGVAVNGKGTTSLGNSGMGPVTIDENGSYTVFLNGNLLSGCSFTVTMKTSDGCSCPCSAGCNSLQSGNFERNPNSSVACIFATSITEINENNGANVILVNGTRPQYCNSESSCRTAMNKVNTPIVDGGYYIEVPVTSGSTQWIRVNSGGVSTPVCGSTTLATASSNNESSSSEQSGGCIAFVSGTGGYDQHCYNSGLLNMKANTCYTLNTANVKDTEYPNNSASDTWWWKETPCL